MESVVSLAASSTVPAGIYTTITHSGHEVASPEVLSEAHDVCYKELAPDAPSQRLRDDQLVSSRCFVILSQNVCMCMVSLFLFLAFSGRGGVVVHGVLFLFLHHNHRRRHPYQLTSCVLPDCCPLWTHGSHGRLSLQLHQPCPSPTTSALCELPASRCQPLRQALKGFYLARLNPCTCQVAAAVNG